MENGLRNLNLPAMSLANAAYSKPLAKPDYGSQPRLRPSYSTA